MGIDMKKLLTIALILCTVTGFAQMRGGAQYDPGAARKNLSNVDSAATPSMTSITLSDKVKAAWADILGDIYASGTVKVGAGTAAAPAYTFSSDPDTGIYSPGANILGFGVGGAENARISAGGNVLIATSTDDGANKLQVNGDSATTGNFLFENTKGPRQKTDAAYLTLAGGTQPTNSYGGFINLVGNDYATAAFKGAVQIIAGQEPEAGFIELTTAGGSSFIASDGAMLVKKSLANNTGEALQVNGFTKLGEAAIGIKMKVLKGTTGASEGDEVTIAHGLTGAKIIGLTCKVEYGANAGMLPFSYSVGGQYYCGHDSTNVQVTLHPTNSENILEKPITIMLWYKE